MCDNSIEKINYKNNKMVNIFKYLVLIFVFLFVGVITNAGSVEGYTIKGDVIGNHAEQQITISANSKDYAYLCSSEHSIMGGLYYDIAKSLSNTSNSNENAAINGLRIKEKGSDCTRLSTHNAIAYADYTISYNYSGSKLKVYNNSTLLGNNSPKTIIEAFNDDSLYLYTFTVQINSQKLFGSFGIKYTATIGNQKTKKIILGDIEAPKLTKIFSDSGNTIQLESNINNTIVENQDLIYTKSGESFDFKIEDDTSVNYEFLSKSNNQEAGKCEVMEMNYRTEGKSTGSLVLSYKVKATGSCDTTYSIKIKVWDKYSQIREITISLHFIVDNEAPTIEKINYYGYINQSTNKIVSSTQNYAVRKQQVYSVTITDNFMEYTSYKSYLLSYYVVCWYNIDTEKCDYKYSTTVSENVANKKVYNPTNKNLEGTYKLMITAYDKSGNTKTATSEETVKIDTVGPKVTFSYDSENYLKENNWQNSGKLTITITDKMSEISPEYDYENYEAKVAIGALVDTGNGFDLDNYDFRNNSCVYMGRQKNCWTYVSYNQLIANFNLSYNKGPIIFVVKTEDALGNTNYAKSEVMYIDSYTPTVEVNTSDNIPTNTATKSKTIYLDVNDGYILQDANYKFEFTVNKISVNDTEIKLNYTIDEYSCVSNDSCINVYEDMPDYIYRYVFEFGENTPTGNYNFEYKICDRAKNCYTESLTLNFDNTEVELNNEATKGADVQIFDSYNNEHLAEFSALKVMNSTMTAKKAIYVKDDNLSSEMPNGYGDYITSEIKIRKYQKSSYTDYVPTDDLKVDGCSYTASMDTKNGYIILSVTGCTVQGKAIEENELVYLTFYIESGFYKDIAGNALNITEKYELFSVAIDNDEDTADLTVTSDDATKTLYVIGDTITVSLKMNRGFLLCDDTSNQGYKCEIPDNFTNEDGTIIEEKFPQLKAAIGECEYTFTLASIETSQYKISKELYTNYYVSLRYELVITSEMDGKINSLIIGYSDGSKYKLVDYGGNDFKTEYLSESWKNIRVYSSKPKIIETDLKTYSYYDIDDVQINEFKQTGNTYYLSKDLYLEFTIKFEMISYGETPYKLIENNLYLKDVNENISNYSKLKNCTNSSYMVKEEGSDIYVYTIIIRALFKEWISDASENNEYTLNLSSNFIQENYGNNNYAEFADDVVYSWTIDYAAGNLKNNIIENGKLNENVYQYKTYDKNSIQVSVDSDVQYYSNEGATINVGCSLFAYDTNVTCNELAFNYTGENVTSYSFNLGEIRDKYGRPYSDANYEINVSVLDGNTIYAVVVANEDNSYLEKNDIENEHNGSYSFYYEKGVTTAIFTVNVQNDALVSINNTSGGIIVRNTIKFDLTNYTSHTIKVITECNKSIEISITLYEYDSTKIQLSSCEKEIDSLYKGNFDCEFILIDNNENKPKRYDYIESKSFNDDFTKSFSDSEKSIVKSEFGKNAKDEFAVTLTIELKGAKYVNLKEEKFDISFKNFILSATKIKIGNNDLTASVTVTGSDNILTPKNEDGTLMQYTTQYTCAYDEENGTRVCNITNLEAYPSNAYFYKSTDKETKTVEFSNPLVIADDTFKYQFNYSLKNDYIAPTITAIEGPFIYNKTDEKVENELTFIMRGTYLAYNIRINDNTNDIIKFEESSTLYFKNENNMVIESFRYSSHKFSSKAEHNDEKGGYDRILTIVFYYEGEDIENKYKAYLRKDIVVSKIFDNAGNLARLEETVENQTFDVIPDFQLNSVELLTGDSYKESDEIKLQFKFNLPIKANQELSDYISIHIEGSSIGSTCTYDVEDENGEIKSFTCSALIPSKEDIKYYELGYNVDTGIISSYDQIFSGESKTIDTNIFIDCAPPEIVLLTTDNMKINGTDVFDIEFKVTDDLGIKSVNINGIDILISNEVSSCKVLSYQLKGSKTSQNTYFLTLKVDCRSESIIEGNLSIRFGVDKPSVLDGVGNYINGIVETNIEINNNKFEIISNEFARQYISILKNESKIKYIDLIFSANIASFDRNMIVVQNVMVYSVEIVDKTKLRVSFKVKENSLDENIVINCLEGLATDEYGNKSIAKNEIDTNVVVSNSQYTMTLGYSIDGCVENDDIYYCSDEKTVQIQLKSDTELNAILNDDNKLELDVTYCVKNLCINVNVNNWTIDETKKIYNGSFTLNIKDYELGDGIFKISIVDLKNLPDAAGNLGRLVTDVNNKTYMIDVTAPNFKNNDAIYVVYLGDEFSENDIVNKYKTTDSEDIYTLEWSDKPITGTNVFCAIGTYENAVIKATDIAGNTSELSITIQIKLSKNVEDSVLFELYAKEEYTYGDDISIEVGNISITNMPVKLTNLSISAEDVKQAIAESLNAVINSNKSDKGYYVIRISSINLIIGEASIEFPVVFGGYSYSIVAKDLDITNCSITGNTREYDGTTTITGLAINCNGVALDYTSAAYETASVGTNKIYHIYGVKPKNSNYKIYGGSTLTYSDGIVSQKELDLTGVNLGFSKYLDGTTNVIENDVQYKTNIYNEYVLITWSSASYSNSSCVFEEGKTQCIVDVIITNPVLSGDYASNYSLKVTNTQITVKGYLNKDIDEFDVLYNTEDRIIYTNSDIELKVEDINDKSKNQEGSEHIYNWYVCTSEVNTSDTANFSLCDKKESQSLYTVSVNKTTNNTTQYIYSSVTNASGITSEWEVFIIHISTDNLIVEKVSSTTGTESSTITYSVGSRAFVYITFNHEVINDSNNEVSLLLQGDLNNTYKFVCDFSYLNKEVGCYYQVTEDSATDTNLKVIGFNGFNYLKDIYGNEYSVNDSYINISNGLNIDTAAGVLKYVEVKVNDESISENYISYYKSSDVTKIEYIFTFENTIKTGFTKIKIYSINNVSKTLELSCSSNDKIITCVKEKSTTNILSNFDDIVMIKSIGEDLDSSKTVSFEYANSLVLNSVYVSEILIEKYNNYIYIDDTDFTMTMTPDKISGNKEIEVAYDFNKDLFDYTNFAKSFNVSGDSKDCGNDGNSACVTISSIDNNKILVSASKSGVYSISLNTTGNYVIKDKVGNIATSNTITLHFDVDDLDASYSIELDGNCITDSNKEMKCGNGGIITFKATFTRKINIIKSAEIKYHIGNNSDSYTVYGSKKSDKEIVFEVKANDKNGVLTFDSVSIEVIDELESTYLCSSEKDESALSKLSDINSKVKLDVTGLTIVSDTISGLTDGKISFGTVIYTITLDSDDIGTVNKNQIRVVDSKGNIYSGANVIQTDINGTSIVVSILLNEYASTDDSFTIKILEDAILDNVNNILSSEYSSTNMVEINRNKPTITVDFQTKLISSLEKITVPYTISNGMIISDTNVCLYYNGSAKVACKNDATTVINIENGDIVVDLTSLKSISNGNYTLVFAKGFVQDDLGNESDEYTTGIIFSYDNSELTFELDLPSGTEYNSTKYIFLGSNGKLQFTIRKNNGEFISDLLSKIKLVNITTKEKYAKSETNKDNWKNENGNITISNIPAGEYYITIDKGILTNDYGSESASYSVANYVVIVYSSAKFSGDRDDAGCSNTSATCYLKEGSTDKTYYIKSGTTLTFTYTMNRYVSSGNALTKTHTYTTSSLHEGLNTLSIMVNDHLGNIYTDSINVFIDNNGPVIKEDSSNVYTYAKSSTPRTVTLKYNVSDDILVYDMKTSSIKGFSYSDGVLKITTIIPANSTDAINITIPAGLFKDYLGNESLSKTITITIQNALFTITSTNNVYDDKYYTNGEIKFILKAVSNSIESVNTCFDGFKCVVQSDGTVIVSKNENITGDTIIRFNNGAFKVKFVNDTKIYESSSVEFDYIFDNSAPSIPNPDIIGVSSINTVTSGKTINVTYTFSEVISNNPTLYIGYGEGYSSEHYVSGNWDSTKKVITFSFDVKNVEGVIYFRLDSVKDLAGNETIGSYVSSGVSVDNTKPTLTVDVIEKKKYIDSSEIIFKIESNEDVKFDITKSNLNSLGLDNIKYSIDNSSWFDTCLNEYIKTIYIKGKITSETAKVEDKFTLKLYDGFAIDYAGNSYDKNANNDLEVLIYRLTTEVNVSGCQTSSDTIYCKEGTKIVITVTSKNKYALETGTLSVSKKDELGSIVSGSTLAFTYEGTSTEYEHIYSYNVISSSYNGEFGDFFDFGSTYVTGITNTINNKKIIIDTVKPVISNLSTDKTDIGMNQKFTFSFDVEENDAKFISNLKSVISLTSGEVNQVKCARENGKYSCTVSATSGTIEGTYKLIIGEIVSDLAGNYNDSAEKEFTVHGVSSKIDSVTISTTDSKTYIKADYVVTIKVIFSDVIDGTLPKLQVTFGTQSSSNISGILSDDKKTLTYEYIVNSKDSGKLNKIELFNGNLLDKYGNKISTDIGVDYNKDITIDNTKFNVTFSSSDSIVGSSAIVTYVCNKECSLNSNNLDIRLNNTNVEIANIAIDDTKITISNLTTGTLTIKIKDLYDLAGNIASSNTLSIEVDTREIEFNGVSISASGNCVESVCGANSTIELTVTASKNIVDYADVKLTIKIGEESKELTLDSVSGKNMKFKYTTVSGNNGVITLSSITGTIKDAYGNSYIDNIASVSLNNTILVDTTPADVEGVVVTKECEKETCTVNGKIIFTLTFNEKLQGYNFTITTDVGSVSTGDKTLSIASNEVVVEMLITKDMNTNNLTISSIEGSFKDAYGNIASSIDFTSYYKGYGIVIDTIVPVVTISNLKESIYAVSSASETINFTYEPGSTLDSSKVCIKYANEGCVNTSNLSVTDNEDGTGIITVSFAKLSGTYRISLQEGFAVDSAGNKSIEVNTTNAFTVNNGVNNIEVDRVSADNEYTKAGINYYYFVKNSNNYLSFDIKTSDNKTFSGNACEYITFYDKDNNEVNNYFICTEEGIRNINITLAENVEVGKTYYFVISGEAIKFNDTTDNNSYNSNNRMMIKVIDEISEVSREESINDSNKLYRKGDTYYIKGINYFNLTLTFNGDVRTYVINNISEVNVGTDIVKILNLTTGTYGLTINGFGGTITYNFEVIRDEVKPVADIEITDESKHLDNYTNSNNLYVTFTNSDTGSGVKSDTVKVSVNGEDRAFTKEDSKLVVSGELTNNDKIKVVYTVVDNLGNTTVITKEFTYDNIAPEVSIEIDNLDPVQSKNAKVSVRVSDAGVGLLMDTISYQIVKEGEKLGDTWLSASIVKGIATIDMSGVSDGNWYIYVASVSDKLGNTNNKLHSENAIIIDNTAPAEPSITFDGNDHYLSHVSDYEVISGTINYELGSTITNISSDGLACSIKENNRLECTLLSVVNEDKETVFVTITITDTAGNSTTYNNITLDKIHIDVKTSSSAEITLDNDWYNNPTKVTSITVSDNGVAPISKKEYSVDGTIYYEFEDSVEIIFDKTSILKIKVTDAAGNVTNIEKEIKVDTTSPTYTYVIKDGNYILDNSYSFNKTITIELTSKDEDIAYYCVVVDGNCVEEKAWSYEENAINSFTVDLNNGNNDITIRAIDKATNIKDIENIKINYNVPKVINDNDGREFINNYKFTFSNLLVLKNQNYRIKFGFIDSESTPTSSSYTDDLKCGRSEECTLINEKIELNGEFDFVYKIFIDDEDYYVDGSITNLKFDTKLEFDGTVKYDDKWTNEDVIVTVDIKEDVSGLKSASLKKGQQKIKDCTVEGNTITCSVSENGEYSINAEDNAGNTIKSETFTIDKIDRQGFDIDFNNTSNEYKKVLTIELEFVGKTLVTEKEAPISTVMWMVVPSTEQQQYTESDLFKAKYYTLDLRGSRDNNSNRYLITIDKLTGDYYLWVYTKDVAGNENFASALLKLDNAAPEVTFNDFPSNWISDESNIPQYINITDNESGVSSITYSYIDEYGKEFTSFEGLEGKYRIKVTSSDNLGNKAEVVSENEMSLDKKGPSIESVNGSFNAYPEFKISDAGSGIKTILYCYGASTGCTPDQDGTLNTDGKLVITIENIGTVYISISAKDNVGNEFSIKDVDKTFDNEKPNITIDYDENKTNDSVKVKVTVTDLFISCINVVFADNNLTGTKDCDTKGKYTIEPYEIDEDSDTQKIYWYSVPTNMIISVYAKDKATNDEIKAVEITNINKTGVKYTVTQEKNEPYEQESTLIVTIKDSGVQMKDIKSINYRYIDILDEKYKNLLSIYDINTKQRDLYLYDTNITETNVSFIKNNETYETKVENITKNGLYVFMITDDYGNKTYAALLVDNIDRDAPGFRKDTLLKGSNSNVFVINEGNYVKVDNNGVIAKSKNFVYKDVLTLVFPIDSVYDGESKVNLVIEYACVESITCTKIINLTDVSGSNKAIHLVGLSNYIGDKYSGEVKYTLVDAAGNYLNDNYTFNVTYKEENDIGITAELIGVNAGDSNYSEWYSNGLKVKFSADNTELFGSLRYWLSDANDTKYCSSILELGTEYSVICDGEELSGQYILNYTYLDILGNEVTVNNAHTLNLDNVAPINIKANLTFNIKKDENDESLYKLKYRINNNYSDYKSIRVLYSDYSEYCVITSDSGECGLFDTTKLNGTEYKVFTQIVDRAGNISNYVSYSLAYDDSRKFEVTESYNASIVENNKEIVITVMVENAVNRVSDIKLLDENRNEIKSLSDFTAVNVNKKYTLKINKSNCSEWFNDGVINKKLIVQVYDEYTVEENATMIGEQEITLDYNFNNFEISFDEENSKSITTIRKNTYKFSSSKDLEVSKYLFIRVSDNVVSVDKNSFGTYCQNGNVCVSGDATLEAGTYSFTFENSKLSSGTYKIYVYGKDKDGHEIITYWGKDISVDNDAPVINIIGTEVNLDSDKAYKIYSNSVTFKISDIKIKDIVITSKDGTKVYESNDIGETNRSISVGGVNSISDGHYIITVTDYMEHSSSKEVIVDTQNDGIAFSNDAQLFNLNALENLNITLSEDMRKLSIELFVRDSRKYNVDITEGLIGGSTLRLINLLDDNILKGIKSQSINMMKITVTNISGLVKEYSREIDVNNPEFSYNNSVSGKKIVIGTDNTYKLTVDVVTGKSDYEVSKSLQNIVSGFIKRVDGKTYSNAKETERLFITINDEDRFDTSLSDWSAYNILDTVGEYTLRFDYTDEAGNAATPISLVIVVGDNEKPKLTLKNKTLYDLQITSKGNANTYTDQGVSATDNYGFDENKTKSTDKYNLTITDGKENTFDIVDNKVMLDGVVYATISGNAYTFIKAGTYIFAYTVEDINSNKITSTVTVRVTDKRAPTITDSNIISITDSLFTLNGNVYRLEIEEEEIIALIDQDNNRIEVEKNIFFVNGRKYIIENDGVRLYGININDSLICFSGECDNKLKELIAYDEEDAKFTSIRLESIKYSKNGSSYGSALYEKEDNLESLFTIKSITFNSVGYYKITFSSVDSTNTNKATVTYIIQVFDNTAPIFVIKDVEQTETTYDENIEYNEAFINQYTSYSGNNIETKITNWIKDWIKANVKVKQNYSGDNGSSYSSKYTVTQIEVNKTNKEFLKFTVTLTASDSSGNTSEITINFIIYDYLPPSNGSIEFSYNQNMKDIITTDEDIYTNERELYFRLKDGSDLTNSIRYQYKIVIDGGDSDWITYNGNPTLAYTAYDGYISTVKVIYRVIDSVDNTSNEIETHMFIFDNATPRISGEYIESSDENEERIVFSSGEIFTKGEKIVITFSDGSECYVQRYINNALVDNLEYNSNCSSTMVDVSFGTYKYVIRDIAGNESVFEFVILNSDNKYNVISNQSLNDIDNAVSVEMTFDNIILQKLSSDMNNFYFENMSDIGDKDKVHLLGIVPNDTSAVFSIYTGGITGKAFKSYTNSFPVNITQLKPYIDSEYSIEDYVININGEKYILIGVEKNASGSSSDDSNGGSGTTNTNKKNNTSSSNFTWALYVLGGIGVLGGGFLILRLKKRVRAA